MQRQEIGFLRKRSGGKVVPKYCKARKQGGDFCCNVPVGPEEDFCSVHAHLGEVQPEGTVMISRTEWEQMQRRLAGFDIAREKVMATLITLCEFCPGPPLPFSSENVMWDEDEDADSAPMFSEGYLYALLGKDDARKVLGCIDSIPVDLGFDSLELFNRLGEDKSDAETAEQRLQEVERDPSQLISGKKLRKQLGDLDGKCVMLVFAYDGGLIESMVIDSEKPDTAEWVSAMQLSSETAVWAQVYRLGEEVYRKKFDG